MEEQVHSERDIIKENSHNEKMSYTSNTQISLLKWGKWGSGRDPNKKISIKEGIEINLVIRLMIFH